MSLRVRRNRYHFVYLLLPSLKRIDCLKYVFLNFIQLGIKLDLAIDR